MQVYFPAGSPQYNYRPCRYCDVHTGWTASDESSGIDTNGTDSGWLTSAATASLALNFTGTGLKFDLAFAPVQGVGGPGSSVGGADSSLWETAVKVNGSKPPMQAVVTPRGVTGLPDGAHLFELSLIRSDGLNDNSTWARVDGAVGTLSYVNTSSTTNVTIDDSQWASGTVKLSNAWNTLEKGHSNYLIPEEEYNTEMTTIDQYLNESISFSTETGAQASIPFKGSAVWVYGVSGGESGSFDVLVDNQPRGTFDASGGRRVYNQLMYHTSGLSEGDHTITMVNRAGRLSFDYLVSSVGMSHTTTKDGYVGVTYTANGPDLPTAPVSASASSSDKPNVKLIVGASVGGVVGLLALTLLGFLLWSCRRKSKRRHHEWSEKPWYKRSVSQEKGWRFTHLPDVPAVPATTGRLTPMEERRRKKASGSSFGSSATSRNLTTLPPPVHTRRSLLPFRNNLWAKERLDGEEDAIPIRSMIDDHRLSTSPLSSPDPMRAALGGASSPLDRLQRSFSNTGQQQSTSAVASSSRPHLPQLDLDQDILIGDTDAAAAAAVKWHNWFGLSDSPVENKKHVSVMSNIRRSLYGGGGGNTAAAASTVSPSKVGRAIGSPSDVDRYPPVKGFERAPRIRFFENKRDTVASQWARW